MGDNSKPVETKRKKKKGRPSLLDLQKRNLRLQKLQSQNPSPDPKPAAAAANPHLRFSAPSRRPTRRNPNPDPAAEEDEEEEDEEDEEEEEGEDGGRREKKLRFVLRLPHRGPDSPSNSAESSGGGARKRRIGDIGADRGQRGGPNSASKATDGVQGQCDPGPTTSLPDKKLLVFILDRLQKKDTYGVFSEPVDPEELPDYHDIIKHPMDFATIRKKLADGFYANLEQFENDVFLISSNAMRYNSSDTIYYRQARAIEELAKKDFENLRQESDDSEPEQKPRRGRPQLRTSSERKSAGLLLFVRVLILPLMQHLLMLVTMDFGLTWEMICRGKVPTHQELLMVFATSKLVVGLASKNQIEMNIFQVLL
uniref:Bromo domain-containing protein n=1 Tax=Ananas comosus var. bracteatus TaxID=296719 RepID=A0A6V7NSA5_ANACO|nr:unnamed protein product [Ananas comosus var. bracteatus]